MKKYLIMALSLLLVGSLCACGTETTDGPDADPTEAPGEDVTGSVQTSGRISVFVPEGFTLSVDCGVLYAAVNGVVCQVTYAGHAPLSGMTALVLGSIAAA